MNCYTVRVTPETHKDLRAASARLGVPISEITRRCIDAWLAGAPVQGLPSPEGHDAPVKRAP